MLLCILGCSFDLKNNLYNDRKNVLRKVIRTKNKGDASKHLLS